MVVNRAKILNNLMAFKAVLGGRSKLCAVVKADAYAHGAAEVASYIESAADMFAVATLDEAAALRYSGITKDILVFAPPDGCYAAERGAALNVIFTLSDEASAKILNCLKGARAHIAVNTGMNRYGFSPAEIEKFFSVGYKNISVEGIYSHLYLAEREEISSKQLKMFNSVAMLAEKTLKKTLIKHIAATGGALSGEEYFLDMVRIGLGLYGYTPFKRDDIRLEKAMKVYAPLSALPSFVPSGCGYKEGAGRAVYRFGYADGLCRRAFEKGCLCMDAFVSEENSGEGDLLIFDDAEKVANKLGSIPYEVLCSFKGRTERRYKDG